MDNPKEIRIEDYSYELPGERIARFPLKERDSSKLLIYKNGDVSEDIFKNIDEYIPENSLMIFNDTKVIQARIQFEKKGGNPIEIFCLHPQNEPVESSLLSKEKSKWICMVGYLKRWKHHKGEVLEKEFFYKGKKCTLKTEMQGKEEEAYLIEFTWKPAELTFVDVLDATGETPIPPYLKRDAVESDKTNYQTIYAEHDGSVAAPTAGLHFTNEVMSKLKQKNIGIAKVTLHVGAGTFKPVKSDTISDHIMHSEFVTIPGKTIDLLAQYSTIICVGTTSMRTIESIPYIAGKISNEQINIDQWAPYLEPFLSKSDQNWIEIIQNHLKTTGNDQISAQTGIIIAPGFKFVFTDILITNFHQPKSTLLLLVSAFLGEDWRKVYEYALKNEFRFLSYGDSSILYVKELNEFKA